MGGGFVSRFASIFFGVADTKSPPSSTNKKKTKCSIRAMAMVEAALDGIHFNLWGETLDRGEGLRKLD